jgi:3-keto-5-aminohexanoate cleavage enzyme
MLEQKKIVNFCPTGTQPSRENSLAPIHVNEIIDNVLSCQEIGLTMIHIHARDEQGKNTYKKEVYQRIIDGVKSHTKDLVIGVSLSGRYFSEPSLRAEVLSLQPDFGSLTMSSMNFPKSASTNDPETILWLINEMDKYGVLPEIECFDSGMLNYTNYLIKKGILTNPLYVNVIYGNLFNAGTDIATISAIIHNLPREARVCFGGIGASQLKANVMGLWEADGVRIGIEDNLYFSGKNLATNQELLQRLHRIMDELDYTVMSAFEFRTLGYGNRKTNNIRS